ncbi:hypothetical protein SB89_10255 [Corynebacterium glutamicum]|nr:hypothetical protein SB89_10255 [Corynebacterium glutamicum]OKX96187.1 hypothetical protein AUP72_00450 [Corynebacterium glutamicum]TWS37443.1 hypothetical protein AKJ21_07455 [Corynebacterium glutamicum]
MDEKSVADIGAGKPQRLLTRVDPLRGFNITAKLNSGDAVNPQINSGVCIHKWNEHRPLPITHTTRQMKVAIARAVANAYRQFLGRNLNSRSLFLESGPGAASRRFFPAED